MFVFCLCETVISAHNLGLPILHAASRYG
jgi:hypothetical protein